MQHIHVLILLSLFLSLLSRKGLLLVCARIRFTLSFSLSSYLPYLIYVYISTYRTNHFEILLAITLRMSAGIAPKYYVVGFRYSL